MKQNKLLYWLKMELWPSDVESELGGLLILLIMIRAIFLV
ncbi:hypothetical protein SALWKB12_0766 [Snodgrassella communis]|uniref:Uncharacterized protein n=1 Tax=Snodgrassella communis TaxID=2946699 RepID=A0A836MSA8_9NEIS|nr:hypothetical protein SALWKB12_0766 [Snodgrassella communis]KDN15267.1 hypothetical protein SALWKB29_0893 [Snodgrassella communis]